MGLAVTEWLAQHPEWQISDQFMVGRDPQSLYFQVPKPDGGFDFYKVNANDTGEASGKVSLISAENLYGETGYDYTKYLGDNNNVVTGGGTTGLSEAEKRAAINKHLYQLSEYSKQRTKATDQYNTDLNKLLQGEQDLTTSKGQGLESNSAYFGSISPDAYQSQIGNYNQKVLDAYNQGMNTIATNKQNIWAAKQNTMSDIAAAIDAENSFDASTGTYSKPYTFKDYGYTSPAITPVNMSPYGQAAKIPGVASWSPNKVGQQEDPWSWLNA